MPGFALSILPLALHLAGAPPAAASCPRQPLPPAIESAALPPLSPHVFGIEFAASPMREYPGEAWVVRLSRRNERSEATLDIVRLRRQMTCNRYDVIGRWTAPLPRADYARIAAQVAPFTVPPADIVLRRDRGQHGVLDGTLIAFRAQAPNWRIERDLNAGDPIGARLAPIFHAVVARHVPAAALPDADWRRRSAPENR
ncbi:hypothetical protein [Sphingomonas sp.]|uniref:hypothetical protein n=1 Tax=Sphingomonas sp. TaxID=28214 RepID=UPI0031E26843